MRLQLPLKGVGITPGIYLTQKLCEFCDKEIPAHRFTRYRLDVKYCSRQCKHYASCARRNPPCLVCGTIVKGTAKKYCSITCRSTAIKGLTRKVVYKKRQCIECRVLFQPTNSTGDRCLKCSLVHKQEYNIKSTADWRQKNKSYDKDRYWKNPRKMRFKSLNRAHLLRSAGGNGITFEEWIFIKSVFNFKCVICFKQEPNIKLTQDHIIPLTKKGLHDVMNIQPLCLSCNARKGAKI